MRVGWEVEEKKRCETVWVTLVKQLRKGEVDGGRSGETRGNRDMDL